MAEGESYKDCGQIGIDACPCNMYTLRHTRILMFKPATTKQGLGRSFTNSCPRSNLFNHEAE